MAEPTIEEIDKHIRLMKESGSPTTLRVSEAALKQAHLLGIDIEEVIEQIEGELDA